MKNLFFIAVSLLFFTSCSKNENDEEPGVWVRLENKTSVVLESARVGDTNYGNVGSSNVTDYQLVTTPIYVGFCTFEIGGQFTSAGYGICGTPPMPPPLKNGYYTFRVEPAQGFFTVVIR
jgi:hypothetical protein